MTESSHPIDSSHPSGGRPPIRMIGTDLDGTLLATDGTISARTVASVRAAVEAGVEVVPTTGRPKIVAADVLAALPFLRWWIFANGSVTWDNHTGEVVRGFFMEPDTARGIIDLVRAELPGVGLALEFPDEAIHEAGFEEIVPGADLPDPVVDVREHVHEPVQKVLVFDRNRTVDELFAAVTNAVGESAVPSYSGLAFIELAAAAVTKASGLADMAADLGIDVSEVAVVGDNHNDLPMFDWAGRSFAMANATDDALAAADEVIGYNDDDAAAELFDGLVAEYRAATNGRG
ncbi:MAG: HAD family hydrolase [Actinomycetota bacterium]